MPQSTVFSDKLELIKQEFSHLDTLYFNSAYFGPSPLRAQTKTQRALARELDPSFYDYNTWMGVPERSRDLFAQLLGVSSDNVAHLCSTSDVNNIVANGMKWQKGDIVCALKGDYPSNVLPWLRAEKRYGIKLVLLEAPPQPTADWLEQNLPPNTKVFSCSHVSFDTGRMIDVVTVGKALRERGILFSLDTTQGLGGLPLSQEEVSWTDIIGCSSYKWLLGPYGHAFGYFSNKALSVLEHTQGNWIKSPNSKFVYDLCKYTDETLPGARKFDRGQAANMLASACLESGLEILLELGLENIYEHNQSLKQYFLDNISHEKYTTITPRLSFSNILALKAKSVDPLVLERELKFKNIDVSVREGNMRLSFHLFNNTEQVDSLLQTLDL